MLTTTPSKEVCEAYVLANAPSANGATWSTADKECFAEYGMTRTAPSTYYTTCTLLRNGDRSGPAGPCAPDDASTPEVAVTHNPRLTSLSLPALEGVGGAVDVSYNARLTSLSADVLAMVDGDVEVSYNAGLESLVLPRLARTAGHLWVYDCEPFNLTPMGDQSDFVWLSARTPHGAYVW